MFIGTETFFTLKLLSYQYLIKIIPKMIHLDPFIFQDLSPLNMMLSFL